jgi:hypothetical protein
VMVDNPTEFAATALSFIKHKVDVTSDWSDRSAAGNRPDRTSFVPE